MIPRQLQRHAIAFALISLYSLSVVDALPDFANRLTVRGAAASDARLSVVDVVDAPAALSSPSELHRLSARRRPRRRNPAAASNVVAVAPRSVHGASRRAGTNSHAAVLRLPVGRQLQDGTAQISSSNLLQYDGSVRVHPGWSFSVGFSQATFVVPDGGPVYYAAHLQGSASLPSWLHFDNKTVTFSGITPHSNGDNYTIVTTGSSKFGGAVDAQDSFTIVVSAHNFDLSTRLPVLNVTAGQQFSYVVPTSAIRLDSKALVPANLSSVNVDVSTASSWLQYDAATRTLSGTPPKLDLVRGDGSSNALQLPVTFTDIFGDRITTSLTLDVFPSYFNSTTLPTMDMPVGVAFTQSFRPFVTNASEPARLVARFDSNDAKQWLHFDPSGPALQGTFPSNATVGQVVHVAIDATVVSSGLVSTISLPLRIGTPSASTGPLPTSTASSPKGHRHPLSHSDKVAIAAVFGGLGGLICLIFIVMCCRRRLSYEEKGADDDAPIQHRSPAISDTHTLVAVGGEKSPALKSKEAFGPKRSGESGRHSEALESPRAAFVNSPLSGTTAGVRSPAFLAPESAYGRAYSRSFESPAQPVSSSPAPTEGKAGKRLFGLRLFGMGERNASNEKSKKKVKKDSVAWDRGGPDQSRESTTTRPRSNTATIDMTGAGAGAGRGDAAAAGRATEKEEAAASPEEPRRSPLFASLFATKGPEKSASSRSLASMTVSRPIHQSDTQGLGIDLEGRSRPTPWTSGSVGDSLVSRGRRSSHTHNNSSVSGGGSSRKSFARTKRPPFGHMADDSVGLWSSGGDSLDAASIFYDPRDATADSRRDLASDVPRRRPDFGPTPAGVPAVAGSSAAALAGYYGRRRNGSGMSHRQGHINSTPSIDCSDQFASSPESHSGAGKSFGSSDPAGSLGSHGQHYVGGANDQIGLAFGSESDHDLHASASVPSRPGMARESTFGTSAADSYGSTRSNTAEGEEDSEMDDEAEYADIVDPSNVRILSAARVTSPRSDLSPNASSRPHFSHAISIHSGRRSDTRQSTQSHLVRESGLSEQAPTQRASHRGPNPFAEDKDDDHLQGGYGEPGLGRASTAVHPPSRQTLVRQSVASSDFDSLERHLDPSVAYALKHGSFFSSPPRADSRVELAGGAPQHTIRKVGKASSQSQSLGKPSSPVLPTVSPFLPASEFPRAEASSLTKGGVVATSSPPKERVVATSGGTSGASPSHIRHRSNASITSFVSTGAGTADIQHEVTVFVGRPYQFVPPQLPPPATIGSPGRNARGAPRYSIVNDFLLTGGPLTLTSDGRSFRTLDPDVAAALDGKAPGVDWIHHDSRGLTMWGCPTEHDVGLAYPVRIVERVAVPSSPRRTSARRGSIELEERVVYRVIFRVADDGRRVGDEVTARAR